MLHRHPTVPGKGGPIQVAAWAMVLLSVVAVLLGLRTIILGDSANSRLATVESLVHHGTWRIDRPEGQPRSVFEAGSVDKVFVNGRLLSSKPPLLPLAMAAEYYVLNKALGWTLDGRDSLKRVVQALTFTFMVLPHVILAIYFLLLLNLFIVEPWQRLLPLGALLWGTQLTGFAAQINNHTPAAALLLVAVYYALGVGSGKLAPHPLRFAAFGLAGGLVFTLDMPLTIYIALSGLYLIYRFPRQAMLWGGLGMAVPLVLHFALMASLTGSPLPVQTRKEVYLYESAPWRNPGGLDGLNEPKGLYAFHLLFGRFGTFLLFPVLTLGLAGTALAAIRRDVPLRGWILGAFAAFTVLTLYYIQSTTNYGGASYGFRWHIGSMPLLLLMALPVFERMKKGWHLALYALLMAVSLYSAWECYRQPWGEQHEWTCRLLFGNAY
ncbi:MAG: hypothetical protein HYV27_16515 [Candidatus Hydrogenedentes bacterium]|nr:hypothetical protein [Candidatus Hydrogenedentota bacterium]